jgi:DNA-binding beta-propeller fold protein YncE
VVVTGGPEAISIPGGFTAYVTTRQGTVVAVDLNTRTVVRTLLSKGQYGSMDYDAINGEVYVPDRQHNQLDVLAPIASGTNALPREPIRVFHLSGSPQSVAITSDGQFGFVALSNGQVVMLDIPGRSIITSIGVGGTPHFIITGLYPPGNNLTSPPSSSSAAPLSARTFDLLPLILLAALVVVLLLVLFWCLWRYSQKRPVDQRSVRK